MDVLREWRDRERDWDDIERQIADAALLDINPKSEPERAKALLVGLWACDRLIDDDSRHKRREEQLRTARQLQGPGRAAHRRLAKQESENAYEQIKSKLIYGFS